MKELESAMREIQASFHAKEERHADRADRLEAEVARLSRDDSDSMTATDRSVNLGWYNTQWHDKSIGMVDRAVVPNIRLKVLCHPVNLSLTFSYCTVFSHHVIIDTLTDMSLWGFQLGSWVWKFA